MLAVVHSTAEYCAPVLCRSAHTRLIDPAINYALRIETGCLRPTPSYNFSILAGIQPAELRLNEATLSLARRAMEPGYLLHSALTRPSSAKARRLKSRHPFVSTAQHLMSSSDNNNIHAAQWADHQWNAKWTDKPARLRRACVRFNPSAPVSDVSAPACTNGVWSPLRPVSVARNKLSTMLSSTVQSIDIPMDCMA